MFPVRSRTSSWTITANSEEGHFSVSNIKMAPAGEGHRYLVYNIRYPLRPHHEHGHKNGNGEMECRGPTARSDMQLHLIKGYIDDLTVTASSVPGSRWIVQTLEKLIRMDDMSSEPDESRSQEIPSTIENQSTVWENSWWKPQRRDNHPGIYQGAIDLA